MSDWIRTQDDRKNTFLRDLVQQAPSAILWLDRILYRENVERVIELGTGHGTCTVLFGLHCPGRVLTIDSMERRKPHTAILFERLGIEFWRADLDLEHVRHAICEWSYRAKRGPRGKMLLLIDKGHDKNETFLEFTEPDLWLLAPGDLVVVHDLGKQFLPEQIEKQIVERGLMRRFEEVLGADHTRLAAYEVIA